MVVIVIPQQGSKLFLSEKSLTCHMSRVTHDTQGVVSIVSKLQVPSSNGLGDAEL